MLAIRIEVHGGPEALQVCDIPVPAPGPGDILVRHEAVGLNFIDIYQRTGLYKIPLPATLGLEAAGVVEAVGEGVGRFKAGDRVAYNGGQGAYAAFNVVKAARAVPLPEAVDFQTAAAALLKGMTAEFLVRPSGRSRRGTGCWSMPRRGAWARSSSSGCSTSACA